MKHKPRVCSRLARATLAVAVSVASGSSFAAGFALIEQSASGLGNAFAAGSAQADDPSALFFNPAAISELDGTQVSFAVHYIDPDAKLENGTASVVSIGGQPTNIPVSGGQGGDAGQHGVVPNFYVVADITEMTKFGLGISVPFGLETDYDNDWIGRYHAKKSDVSAITINPALSLRLHEQVSFGFGFNAQYIEAKLTSSIDSGSTCLALAAAGGAPDPTAVCTAFGLAPADRATDSFGEVEGDDWGFGFNVGLMYKPWQSTRFGLAYRSKIDQSLEGDGTFNLSAPFAAFIGANPPPFNTLFSDANVVAGVTLPATASVSGLHKIGTKFEIMADITWTEWSEFDELRVKYVSSPIQPDSVTTQDWDNSLRYSVGLSYFWNERLKLRTGIAYDETPIPNSRQRTPRIPGNDRFWTALGLTWKATKKLSFDVAYAHLFVEDPDIDNTTEGIVEHNLQGRYDADVDIFSAQVNYIF